MIAERLGLERELADLGRREYDVATPLRLAFEQELAQGRGMIEGQILPPGVITTRSLWFWGTGRGTPHPPRRLTLSQHLFQPMKPDASVASWIENGAETIQEPLDPGFLTPDGELRVGALDAALKALIASKYSKHLARASVRSRTPSAGDSIRVALVDLTGRRLLEPEFAGWGSTVALNGGSALKVAPLYAAFQLAHDLRHLASKHQVTDVKSLAAAARSAGFPGPPDVARFLDRTVLVSELDRLRQRFPQSWKDHGAEFLEAIRFSADVQQATTDIIDQHKANDAAGLLIRRVGFPYIASLMWRSGLWHPTRGGLWLTTSYGKGLTRWDGAVNPGPAFRFGYNVTGLALATFFTLLAQRRLVTPKDSDEIRDRLSTASFYSKAMPSARIASKVGILSGNVHEAALIENDGFRYVAAIMTTGLPKPVALLEKLVIDLEGLVRANNP